MVMAQKSGVKAFAITSEKQGQQAWNEVKMIDLQSGEVLRPVYQNNGTYNVFNARNGNAIRVKDEKGVVNDQSRLPFSSLSAACAFDKKHNRLYYTPMFVNELRYFDLDAGAAKIYYFEGEKLTTADLDNAAFPWLTGKEIEVAGIGVRALRVNYVGELGWELHVPMDKVVVTVDEHGNTSAASIPLALDVAIADGRIKRGDLVLLQAVGGGFTWGAALVRW